MGVWGGGFVLWEGLLYARVAKMLPASVGWCGSDREFREFREISEIRESLFRNIHG